MEYLPDILGWGGTALIVLAYLLVSLKKVDSGSAAYQATNLLGAMGLGGNVFYEGAWPAVALQITWGAIAAVALVSILKKRAH